MYQTTGDRLRVPDVVRIGGLDRAALHGALRARGVLLNRLAEVLFEDHRFQPAAHEQLREIVALCGADLGFSGGATYRQLTERALDAGLRECPLELGPHLRMQFGDQLGAPPSDGHGAPHGSVTVASGPLDESDETPRGFYLVRRDGVAWLRGYRTSQDHEWLPHDVLVFCRSGH